MTPCPNCGYRHANLDCAPELSGLALPSKRADVLLRLQQAKGALVTVDQLISFVYDDDDEPDAARNCIHCNVSRLRTLAQPLGWTISSVRHRGYRLVRVAA